MAQSGQTKTYTFRLPADLAEVFETVARADDLSLVEALRRAIQCYVETRHQEEQFRKALEELPQKETHRVQLVKEMASQGPPSS